jgi:4-amino-4-deoxy-L-arabinose transferase-like glycosyltransferase
MPNPKARGNGSNRIASYRDWLACALITLLGAVFRLYHYDTVPHHLWTADEYAFAWSGMSLLRDHVPTGWSWLKVYGSVPRVEWQGDFYKLVTPWLDHPPLFSLLPGAAALAGGAVHFFDCTLSVIRIPSLLLGIASLPLLYVLSLRIGGTTMAMIATLIYAVNPNTVFLSRLAVAENLIVVLSLLVMLLYVLYSETSKSRYLYIAAVLAGLACLAKVTGIYLVGTLCALSLLHGRWREFLNVALIGAVIFSIYPIYGWYYDFDLFVRVVTGHAGRFNFADLPRVTRMFYSHGDHPLPFDPVFLFGWLVFVVYAWKTAALIVLPLLRSNQLGSRAGAFGFAAPDAKTEEGRLKAEVVVTPVVSYAAVLFASGGISHLYPWYGIPFYPFIFLAIGAVCADRIAGYRRTRRSLSTAL